MNEVISRRDVFLGIGAAAATVSFCGASFRAELAGPGSAPATNAAWPNFPHLDPKLVAEVVGKAHFDESSVRKLVTEHPSLVNACWDWGFGDWETPLGAASHTGRRAIAEYLIEQGARIDIFAATMLGYTDVVKAMVAASPGVQRTLGPHCITLLAHAKVGGEKAYSTLEFLKSLGDADNAPAITPITDAEKQKFVGVYAYGASENDRLQITIDDRGSLLFQKTSDASRIRIHSVGNGEFFPAGSPTTRFSFDTAKSPAVLTIAAGPQSVVSTRTVAP